MAGEALSPGIDGGKAMSSFLRIPWPLLSLALAPSAAAAQPALWSPGPSQPGYGQPQAPLHMPSAPPPAWSPPPPVWQPTWPRTTVCSPGLNGRTVCSSY